MSRLFSLVRILCFEVDFGGYFVSWVGLCMCMCNDVMEQGLIRFWPWSCSSKQVLFLNELEDVLELLMEEQVK